MAEWVRVGNTCFNLDTLIAVILDDKGNVHVCDATSEDWKLEGAEANAFWAYMGYRFNGRYDEREGVPTFVIPVPDHD